MVQVVTCSRCNGTGEVIETPCDTCQGGRERKTVKKLVNIPGVSDGVQIRRAGEGQPGTHGGPRQFLPEIEVEKHPFFRR